VSDDINADKILNGGYVGWKRFLYYFARLSRPPTSTEKTRRRWRRQREDLGKQIGALQERSQAIWKKIEDSCAHPVEMQKVVSSGREDSYGSWRAGSDYVIACLDCGKRLAKFSSEQEEAAEREGPDKVPWEVKR
jgi:hypothetical protein